MAWQVRALVDAHVFPNSTAKLVAGALANRADKTGSGIRESIWSLASFCQRGERCVQMGLRMLEKHGLAEVEREADPRLRTPRHYRLRLDRIEALPLTETERAQRARGAKSAPVGVQKTTGRGADFSRTGAGSAPKPLSEPEQEEKEEPEEGTPARATRFSSDFEFPSTWRTWASSEGHPNPDRAFEKFRDHWVAVAGPHGLKRDWFAAFRNWIRKDVDDEQKQPRSGRNKESPSEQRRRRRAGLAAAVDRRLSPASSSACPGTKQPNKP